MDDYYQYPYPLLNFPEEPRSPTSSQHSPKTQTNIISTDIVIQTNKECDVDNVSCITNDNSVLSLMDVSENKQDAHMDVVRVTQEGNG